MLGQFCLERFQKGRLLTRLCKHLILFVFSEYDPSAVCIIPLHGHKLYLLIPGNQIGAIAGTLIPDQNMTVTLQDERTLPAADTGSIRGISDLTFSRASNLDQLSGEKLAPVTFVPAADTHQSGKVGMEYFLHGEHQISQRSDVLTTFLPLDL